MYPKKLYNYGFSFSVPKLKTIFFSSMNLYYSYNKTGVEEQPMSMTFSENG